MPEIAYRVWPKASFDFVLTFGDRSLDHGHIVISISRNGFLGFLSLSPSCAERKRWSVTAVICISSTNESGEAEINFTDSGGGRLYLDVSKQGYATLSAILRRLPSG